MNADILVSVVIPVKNGESWLNETIPAILSQQMNGGIEIIAVDSGSTDETLRILSEYPIKLVQIRNGEFNHGLTRNLGARMALGKYIVMTVQDAKPISPYWLQELLNGFTDETVAAVCGQQIVTHDIDKNPAEWYRPVSKAEIRKYQFKRREDFLKLSPDEQLAICRWDDVNAMYRSEIMRELPFRETDFAEDVLWAKDALLAGHSIVYNPLAQVAHYHHENFQYAFNRNFIVRYHFYKFFGVLPVNQHYLRRMLSVIKVLLKSERISLFQKLSWIKYNYDLLKAVRNSNTVFLKSIDGPGKGKLELVYKGMIQSIPQAESRNIPKRDVD
jgi:rhamnosyltransferase